MSDVKQTASNSLESGTDGGIRLSHLDRFTPGSFDPYVNDVFRVQYLTQQTSETHVNPLPAAERGTDEPKIVELILEEVTRHSKLKQLEGGFEHRPREPFSLLFRGPLEPTLMSAVHEIEHDQLGRGTLFLGPIIVPMKNPRDLPRSQYYEAIFC